MSFLPASIDDNDSTVAYSTNWVSRMEDGRQWSGTMHSTSIPGSWARFQFTGSRVAIICVLPSGTDTRSAATVSLNGNPGVLISHPTTPSIQFNFTFWDSGPIPFQTHVLEIFNAGTDAFLSLDRIDFDPTTGNSSLPIPISTSSQSLPRPQIPTSRSGSQSTTGSATRFTTMTTLRSQVQSTPAPIVAPTSFVLATSRVSAAPGPIISSANDSALSRSSSSSSGNSAVIIGSVAGGLMALILFLVILFACRTRRKRPAVRGIQSSNMLQDTLGSALPHTFLFSTFHSTNDRSASFKSFDDASVSEMSIADSEKPISPRSRVSQALSVVSMTEVYEATNYKAPLVSNRASQVVTFAGDAESIHPRTR